MSIGGLGHLARVVDGDKLARIRDACKADPTRRVEAKLSPVEHAHADGMAVLRALASIVHPIPHIEALREDPTVVAGIITDTEFLDLIRSTPIRDYLTSVAKQYAHLFGAGIAALVDVLDVDHIALCGTIPEFLQHNLDFVNALQMSLPENIPGMREGVGIGYGSMLRWGWRGAALLPRDPGYMRRRFPAGSRSPLE